ncbi:MAG: hypothetical protein JNL40_13075 [Cyclobacteriaceae bacterium]|nr:hypothetical protein [Cyclobacteriaceae bacterium]
MKERSTYRKLMIAAGLLAALTILLSPTFELEASRVLTEFKATAEPGGNDTYVNVSPDAVTTSQAVEVESANPFTIQEIITEGEQTSLLPPPRVTLPASVLSTFLRSVISPQAP